MIKKKLIKIYDHLQFVIIDKIFFVGSRMLTFIDHRLQKQVIKQVHNKS